MGTKARSLILGLVIAGTAAGFVTTLLAQSGGAQPVKSEVQYFVTGEGDSAHLWVREGAAMRCVGHGECTSHGDHKGHDHGKGKGE